MVRRADECKVGLREKMRGGDGMVKITDIVSAEELYNKGRLFANITLNPGCGIGYHVHEKESEIFYVMKGSAVYDDNGKETVIEPGDVTITPDGCGHAVTNKSDTVVELIALIIKE